MPKLVIIRVCKQNVDNNKLESSVLYFCIVTMIIIIMIITLQSEHETGKKLHLFSYIRFTIIVDYFSNAMEVAVLAFSSSSATQEMTISI